MPGSLQEPGGGQRTEGPSFRAGTELGLPEGQVLCWMSPEGPGTRGAAWGPAPGQTGRRKAARLQEGLPSPAEVGGPELRFLCWVWSALCWSCDTANLLQGNWVHCLSVHLSDSGQGRTVVPGVWPPPASEESVAESSLGPSEALRGPLSARLRSHRAEGQSDSSSGVGGSARPPEPSDRGRRLPGGRGVNSPSLQAGEARLGAQRGDERPGGLSAPREVGCLPPEVLTRDLERLSSPVHTESSQGPWRRCGYHSGSH